MFSSARRVSGGFLSTMILRLELESAAMEFTQAGRREVRDSLGKYLSTCSVKEKGGNLLAELEEDKRH